MSLWIVIAKNEIRLKTSRIRNYRRFFFIIIYSISFYWGFFFGLAFLDAIIPEFIKEVSNQFETLIVQLIEYTFTTFFLMAVIYPLFVLFRKAEIDKKEIILTSPAKPGDIILGEFIGRLPFYFLFILIIGPFGIILIKQINPNINLFHHLIFYLCFFALFMFGSLIGIVISNWIEYKILASKKIKNLGNAFLILISIFIIIMFYLFHFVLEFIRDHPEIKKFFLFYPSFWYSNIIIYFVNFTLIKSYVLNIWISVILAIVIPILFSYISYKKANIFYDLRFEVEKRSKPFKQENYFYKFVRKTTPRYYRELVILHFKAFIRKKEVIIKLIYIIGIICVLGLFIYFSFESQIITLIIEPIYIPIMLEITFDKNIITIIISWMGGLIFGIFMGMYDFIGPKELLFTYKKSPRGIKALIFSYLYELLFILLIYDIVLTIFFTIVFRLVFLISLLFFLMYIINSMIIVLQAIGIQGIRPLFEERRKNLIVNNYLILFFQIISFLITLLIFIPVFPETISHYLGFMLIILINQWISGCIAISIFYLGIRKLNVLE